MQRGVAIALTTGLLRRQIKSPRLLAISTNLTNNKSSLPNICVASWESPQIPARNVKNRKNIQAALDVKIIINRVQGLPNHPINRTVTQSFHQRALARRQQAAAGPTVDFGVGQNRHLPKIQSALQKYLIRHRQFLAELHHINRGAGHGFYQSVAKRRRVRAVREG